MNPKYNEALKAVISFYRFHNVEFDKGFVQEALRLLNHRDFYYEQLTGDMSNLNTLYEIAIKIGCHSVDDNEMEICSLARILEIVAGLDPVSIEAVRENRLVGGIEELADFTLKIHAYSDYDEYIRDFEIEVRNAQLFKLAREELLSMNY